ncbi:MAG: hypothetical protein K2G09_07820, partial [Paramuribaculum sp.]|nr:hypothetical protein [Paramuribaculum sp.]
MSILVTEYVIPLNEAVAGISNRLVKLLPPPVTSHSLSEITRKEKTPSVNGSPCARMGIIVANIDSNIIIILKIIIIEQGD